MENIKNSKKQMWITPAEKRMIEILRAYQIPPEEVLKKFDLRLNVPLKEAR